MVVFDHTEYPILRANCLEFIKTIAVMHPHPAVDAADMVRVPVGDFKVVNRYRVRQVFDAA